MEILLAKMNTVIPTEIYLLILCSLLVWKCVLTYLTTRQYGLDKKISTSSNVIMRNAEICTF